MNKKDKKVLSKDSAELSDENASAVSGGFKWPKFHAGIENGEFKAGVELPKSEESETTKKIKGDIGYYKNLLSNQKNK